ncbi:MAG: NAD(P)-dependent oxidoreductase [Actinomycetota bacterium]|nr:NAD(P)-dependent oxidoreductase [Actinomycetota bacterium]
MKVLVTGASGFLGRFVVDAFLARGHDVRALVRPATKVDGMWRGPVDVVRADLAAFADGLDGVFDDVDALVHLAAAKGGDEQSQFAATAVGTERLLEAMSRSACRRLVLASSTTVYDWVAAESPVDETAPIAADLEARGGYTRAKVWQERVVHRLSDEHGFAATVLRPGILWGPGDPCPEGLTLRARGVEIVFGIRSRLPLTFVENCAECFVTVVESDATVGQTFNVVDPDPPPTRRFVSEYVRRTGASNTLITVPYRAGVAAVRAIDAVNRVAFGGKGRMPSAFVPARFVARFRPLRFTSAKLEAIAGWRPPYDVDAALERTYGPSR